MDVLEYNNIVYLICEKVGGTTTCILSHERDLKGIGTCSFMDRPDKPYIVEPVGDVAIFGGKINRLWKHNWVRRKTFEIEFEEPVKCKFGVSAYSGRRVLVCGEPDKVDEFEFL